MKCVLVTLHYFEGIEIVTLLLYILYTYTYAITFLSISNSLIRCERIEERRMKIVQK